MQGVAPDKDMARTDETMNSVFRVYKYPVDYSAFTGKTLTPGNVIEKSTATSANNLIDESAKYRVFPNPFSSRIKLVQPSGQEKFELLNITGQSVWKGEQIEKQDFSHLKPGIFILNISDSEQAQTVKLIKH